MGHGGAFWKLSYQAVGVKLTLRFDGLVCGEWGGVIVRDRSSKCDNIVLMPVCGAPSGLRPAGDAPVWECIFAVFCGHGDDLVDGGACITHGFGSG